MGESLLVTVFGMWLLLSVLVLFPGPNAAIRRWDWFALIPEWRFFAPVPGQHDYYVLYRDKFSDDTVTDWTELEITGHRWWWSIVWNPGRRANKALLDTVMELAVRATAEDPVIEISIPYLTLINYVSSVPRSASPKFTQFLLMRSPGRAPDEEPEVLFGSELHSL